MVRLQDVTIDTVTNRGPNLVEWPIYILHIYFSIDLQVDKATTRSHNSIDHYLYQPDWLELDTSTNTTAVCGCFWCPCRSAQWH